MKTDKKSWIPAFASMTGVGALGSLPILTLFALPLLASLFFAFENTFDGQAWQNLFAHPQLWSGLRLSIYTGAASTILALAAALLIIIGAYESKSWHNLPATMGAMLALPHLALAIGLSFLIMPSGILARIVANIVGWQTPPQWVTTHDPYGIALIIALAIKEAPFIVWVLAGFLNREDIRQKFALQRAAAQSLGHGTGSIWLRIFVPQLMPKLIWPLVIVFVYAATVVDMSLAIGPTQPPTLATVIWADINSEQVVNNARGGVGAIFLSLALLMSLVLAWSFIIVTKPIWKNIMNAAPSTWAAPVFAGHTKLISLEVFYVLIAALLFFMSLAQNWPFPNLVPTASLKPWGTIFQNPNALITSIVLATLTSFTALSILLLWLEMMNQKTDRIILWLSLALLGLPAILVGLGQYRAFLRFGLTANMAGLFLSHLLPVVAYMAIVLVGPYRAIDPRFSATAKSLQASTLKFFIAIKLPLLKAPILSALAVGFAVSFGQFIPAQLIGAGRFSTLPIEAVTLTSGANRPLTAAFAFLLMLPPLLVYVAAARFGRSRWSNS